MTKSCRNDERLRESRPWDSGNIQRLAEALKILDSRFHGNDERLRESRLLGGGSIQRLAEALEILDSRFHGNGEASDGIVHPPHRHSRAGGNPERKI